MKRFFSSRLINIILRSITIALKFLLSILVIKKLSIEDYGVLGLFQSSIIIMTFILGLDFYSYSSREILKKGSKGFSFYFKNQIIFHFLVYLIIIPTSYIIFRIEIINFNYLNLFYFILVSEHISQELYRLLIILKKTIYATLVLFLRSGLWIIFLYFIWHREILSTTIETLLYLWLSGALLSVIFGLRHINFKWAEEIDLSWIKKGVKIAFPFFIGTVLYKLIEFSGRYFLKYYFSTQEVGVFTFYSSVSNILFVFVQTVVIIELFPILLESRNMGNANFALTLREFSKQTKKFTVIGFLLSITLIYPLLLYLDKTVLTSQIISYFILLISTTLFCLSFISHYALYSYKKDFDILKATSIGFFFNLLFSFLLIPKYGVIGAAFSQLAAYLAMYIMKLVYWKKIKVT